MLKGVARLVGGGSDPLLCAVTRERRVFCWNGPSPPASEEPYPAGVNVLDARQYLGWIPFPPIATAPDTATAKRSTLVPRPRRSGSPDTIVRLAVSSEDACVLRGDGRAYCWIVGREDAPRLLTPTPLVDIAVGGRVICGVTEDGSVPCWTLEENDTLTPWQPLGLRDAARIDAMEGQCCVLHTHGRVTCVSRGVGRREGQAPVARLEPIHGIEDAIQAQTQPFGVCALRARGGVACWHERFGLLEYGAPTDMRHIVPDATGTMDHRPSEPGEPRTTITAVASDGRLWQARLHEPALTPVVEQALRWQRLAYGPNHRCGITTDERLVCWGDNVSGRLGRGFVSMAEAEPAQVLGLPPIRHVQLFAEGGCASDGTSAWCWGRSKAKRLRANQPTRVSIDTPIRSFAFASGQGAAIDTRGDLWVWGDIGVDPFELTHDRGTPVRVHAGEPLETIRLGRLMHCGITRSKRVVCWHGTGQPVPISLPEEVQSLSLRDNEACATVAGERTFCWQASASGGRVRTVTLSQPIEAPRHATPPATGPGSRVRPPQNEPTPPDAPEGCRRTGAASFRCGNDEIVFPAPITAVAGRAREDRDTWCALAEGGKLYCLGFGRDGQLGNSRGGTRPVPVRVALP